MSDRAGGAIVNYWEEFLAVLRALFRTRPSELPPPGEPPQALRRRVLSIIYNPTIAAEGERTLSEVLGWNDPDTLAEQYIADLRETSGGFVDYQVVQRIEAGDWPVKTDGFRYDAATYLENWRSGQGWHDPDRLDYEAVLADFDLLGRIDADQIDEVWLFGFPFAGFYESRMVGPGAFWCNAPPMDRGDVGRRFVIMGFNYQRGVGEMLEAFNHRVESHMDRVWRHFGDDPARNLWKRFTLYDQVAPGRAECGSVHFAPNSEDDYDWGNRRLVPSRCDNWLNFPDLEGEPRQVNCEEWGEGDIRAYHKWWLSHLPRAAGETEGISNNWWWYVVDPNVVR
jgi:hypothetical protein